MRRDHRDGRTSAVAFHVECGLINAGGAIHNADRGHYPVLIMSGYPPSAEMGSVPGARNSYIQWYQQIRDQGELLRQYMRWDHKLAPYDNAGLVITRAVQVMSIDGMKRLASRSTWWHTLPHKSDLAVNAAERGDQPWIILASTSTRGRVRSAF